MRKLNKKNKILIAIIVLPLILIAQYYMFKLGVISPLVKGVDIKIIQGEYLQDIDKYVVKLGEPVVLSAGDYIKVPTYAKDPKIEFKILDDSKTIKLTDNSKNEENTVILEGLKKGYTSVAVIRKSKIIQRATVLVVDPTVENLNVTLNGSLKYVGDKGEYSATVEVDYKQFNNSYDVTYTSSNEKVLKVIDNKVEAVGVGNATVYVKAKDEVKALRYKITAKVKDIEIKSSFNIVVGESIKLKPEIITQPLNLKPPKVNYKFAESKLPIERCVTIDDDGQIIGIREGKEKIIISCGVGDYKRTRIVTINVKEGSIENRNITNIYSTYSLQGNNLNIDLNWDILSGASNYDIYIKNNNDANPSFEIYRSITQGDFVKNKKVSLSIPVGENDTNISYEIYVVGRNEVGSSKPSNIVNISIKLENTEDSELPEEPEIPDESDKPNESDKPDDIQNPEESDTPSQEPVNS